MFDDYEKIWYSISIHKKRFLRNRPIRQICMKPITRRGIYLARTGGEHLLQNRAAGELRNGE